MYLPRSTELIIINEGFSNSEGWKEKLNNFIHLLAPFVSGKKNIVQSVRVIPTKNKKKETKIRFFKESWDNVRTIIIPVMQKIRCFFRSSSEEK